MKGHLSFVLGQLADAIVAIWTSLEIPFDDDDDTVRVGSHPPLEPQGRSQKPYEWASLNRTVLAGVWILAPISRINQEHNLE